MKIYKKIITFAVTATILATTYAENWELSMGANYRTFNGIELKNRTVNKGGFLDGSVTGIDTNADQIDDLWLYQVSSPLQQIDVANLNEVTYTQATLGRNNVDMDDGIGLVLKGRYALTHNDQFNIKLDLSLTTATTSSRLNVNGIINTVGFNIGEVWNNSPFPGGGPTPDQLEKLSLGHADMGILVDGNGQVLSRIGFDLNLYTFGLGISGQYDLGDFSLFAGIGPTVSIVDYEVKENINGYWKDGSGTFYQESNSEKQTKLRGGFYAELGLSYAINEKWGMGIAGRYDYIPVKVTTDIGDIDLTGFGVQLFISYSF